MTLEGLLHPVCYANSEEPIATQSIKKCWHLSNYAGFVYLLSDIDVENQSANIISYQDATSLVNKQDDLKKLPTIEQLRELKAKEIK